MNRLRITALLLALAYGFIPLVAEAGSVKVGITFPKGSAGEKAPTGSGWPTASKFTPCGAAAENISNIKYDATSFSITYDAKSLLNAAIPLDLYVFFYNPESKQIYSVTKNFLQNGVKLTPYASAAELQTALVDATLEPYIAGTDNFSTGSVTENIFGSYISVEGLDNGTWEFIAILGDSTINLQNPRTWSAWDVISLYLAMPWKGAAGVADTCQ